jgi:glycosyltransferase involved in cell wall biosynthesis
MAEPVTLSVVAPCHNEADNLVPFVEAIRAALDPLKISYEIVITDDRSTDSSWKVLSELAAKDPRVRAVRHEKNAGQSAAVWSAIKNSTGKYIATLDADLQNDPADLPLFLDAMKNADCICGNRKASRAGGDSIIRQLSSKIANGIRNWMTHETVTDSACGYRMFKRECVADLKFFKGMHRFMPTLIKIEGFNISEIPIRHHERRAGASHYGVWNRAFAALYDLFAVRWMQKRMFRFRVSERLNFPPEK